MDVPFSVQDFLAVFERYNRAVWPLQIIFNLLALGAVFLGVKRYQHSDRSVAGILALLWIWIGVVYHFIFFTQINPAAYFFGALFVIQGFLFFFFGVLKHRIEFRYTAGGKGLAGGVIILYAILLYPLIGSILGHSYPQSPTFGLPCPTTIFTFGLLVWTERKVPPAVLIIPLLWSVIGFAAAFSFGIWEDSGLLVSGIAGFVILLAQNRKIGKRTQPSATFAGVGPQSFKR